MASSNLHEVRPSVQTMLGLTTTRAAPVVYATAPMDCKVGKHIFLTYHM